MRKLIWASKLATVKCLKKRHFNAFIREWEKHKRVGIIDYKSFKWKFHQSFQLCNLPTLLSLCRAKKKKKTNNATPEDTPEQSLLRWKWNFRITQCGIMKYIRAYDERFHSMIPQLKSRTNKLPLLNKEFFSQSFFTFSYYF